MPANDIKQLLNKYNIHPSKGLGQNFLCDETAFKKIIEAASPLKDDLVLEIGPGIGNLTVKLAQKAKKVIIIEKDQRMAAILEETLRGFNNIEIIQEDILRVEDSVVGSQKYKVVANLPYYITSPVIRKFLESANPPEQMVLMVQKEVAQRICSKPPNMSLLAVSVQFYANPAIISYVSKKSFWPSPMVDSAIIKISEIKNKPIADREQFFRIVKAGFTQPRKQLINNLSKGLKIDKEKIKKILLENNILPNQRAETLTIESWLKLTKRFKITI